MSAEARIEAGVAVPHRAGGAATHSGILSLVVAGLLAISCGGSGGGGGAGGSGGGTAGGSAGGTAGGSGGGSAGGTAGGSGGGSTSASLNGCTSFADHTSAGDARTIAFTFPAYTPPCMLISAGQSVTFSGSGGADFSVHPLTPGKAPSSSGTSSAGNPITTPQSGSSKIFAFPTAGTYGFYCANHESDGMYGAIKVQ